MPGSIAKRAVVIGAGMGGLAAAKAVAPFFDTVIALDRDALPEEPAPRVGTPQARHAHALLAGGQQALEELFPGIGAELSAAGAVKTRVGRDIIQERPGFDPFPRRDLGFDVLCLSRPLLETVCRRRLRQAPNIEIRPRSRVAEVVPAADHRGVAAVRYETESGKQETLAADLVVDASGRAAPTLALLESIGSPKPPETEIGVDLSYASAVFEIPAGAARDWKGVSHYPAFPDEARGGLILRIERGRWIVSLGGVHGDAPPDDIEGFRAFAKSFRTPTFFDAISGARQVGEIARYNQPASIRRHFHKLEQFPRGLIPLGDAVCRFNPVFGQGMSVAAQEAVILGRLLDAGRAAPLDGLAEDYLSRIQDKLEAPWATAVFDLVDPRTRGERPADLGRRLQYGRALLRLAAEDAETHKIMMEVNHLIRLHSALREPQLAARVMARMQAAV